MSAPGPFGRRLFTGPHRGHLELCAVTYGHPCDLECLELEHLLDDLEHQALDELSVPWSAWLWLAAVAGALVAFWSVVAWLLWSMFR